MALRYLTLILLSTLCYNSFAQQRVIDRHFNTWWSNINKYKVSDRLFFSSEIHIRRVGGLEYWQQFLFRPGINYKANDNLILTAGYTYIRTSPYGKQPLPILTPENNIWEEATLKHGAGKFKFSHRYRLEHRFIGGYGFDDEGNIIISGNRFAQRFRYRITGSISFGNEDKFFAEWFDEIWINLEDNFMPVSMNQNWLYGGLGYKFSDRGKIGLGYMQQLIRKGDGIHYENNSTLQFTVWYVFGG